MDPWKIAKITKIRTHKNFVPHGKYIKKKIMYLEFHSIKSIVFPIHFCNFCRAELHCTENATLVNSKCLI